MIAFRFLLLLCVCLSYVFSSPNDHLPKDCTESQSVRVLNWNIMAPMWTDPTSFHAAIIDRRLLNATTRFNIIVKALKESNSDIILLQEVQQDWLQPLQKALSPDFSLAIYGPHLQRYWSSHLPRYRIYKNNGPVTFYRSNKLFRTAARSIKTTGSGNIVTLAAFAMKQNNLVRNDVPRVVVANGQLERGLLGFFVRESQIKYIHEGLQIMKSRQRNNKQAQIIWSGDFNTYVGFRTYAGILQYGYENVFDDLGIPNPPNYFRTLGTPHATSYTFVENSALLSGSIKVVDSFFDPAEDVRSENEAQIDLIYARANYLTFLQERLGLNQTEITSLIGDLVNNLMYDHPLNNALRRGSDHTYQRSLFCLY